MTIIIRNTGAVLSRAMPLEYLGKREYPRLKRKVRSIG